MGAEGTYVTTDTTRFETDGFDRVVSAILKVNGTLAKGGRSVKAVNDQLAKQQGLLEKVGKAAKSSYTEMRSKIMLAVGAAKMLAAALKEGADATEAYAVALHRGIGSDFIKKLHEASGYIISTTDMQRTAIKQKQLGLGESQQITIAKMTAGLAQQTGKDPTEIVNTLTDAIAKGRVQALQSLGVYVDVKQAMDSYAKSVGKTTEELTQLERQEAALRHIQANNQELFKKLETNADRIRRLTQTVAEKKSDFLEGWSVAFFGFNAQMDVSSDKIKDQINLVNERLAPSFTNAINGWIFSADNYRKSLNRLTAMYAIKRDEERRDRSSMLDLMETLAQLGHKYDTITTDEIPALIKAEKKLIAERDEQIKQALQLAAKEGRLFGSMDDVARVTDRYVGILSMLYKVRDKLLKQQQPELGDSALTATKTKSDQKRKTGGKKVAKPGDYLQNLKDAKDQMEKLDETKQRVEVELRKKGIVPGAGGLKQVGPLGEIGITGPGGAGTQKIESWQKTNGGIDPTQLVGGRGPQEQMRSTAQQMGDIMGKISKDVDATGDSYQRHGGRFLGMIDAMKKGAPEGIAAAGNLARGLIKNDKAFALWQVGQQLAMGFATMFVNPPQSAAHFISAGLFAAQAIKSFIGGGSSKPGTGTSPPSPSAARFGATTPRTGDGRDRPGGQNVFVFNGPIDARSSARAVSNVLNRGIRLDGTIWIDQSAVQRRAYGAF